MQVATGIDPGYAALGVLTTGALGTVLYSYVASDSDLATSATSMASGVLSDLMSATSRVGNADLVKHITDNKIVRVAKKAIA